jgi:predicted nucleic acid-binding protein
VTRYFDSSALVKRYVDETGSRAVRRLLASGSIATSRLSEVEVTSAIRRRIRESTLSTLDGSSILAALTRDVRALVIVELTPEVVAIASGLLERHTLRSSDAVQLASAVYLRQQLAAPMPFVAFDARLVAAARAEGLSVVGRGRLRA